MTIKVAYIQHCKYAAKVTKGSSADMIQMSAVGNTGLRTKMEHGSCYYFYVVSNLIFKLQ